MSEIDLIEEMWRPSELVPLWEVSNLGRIKNLGQYNVLRIKYDPYQKDYVAYSRKERRYIKVYDVYFDAFGDPGDEWVPDLDTSPVPTKRDYRRGRVYCVDNGKYYPSAAAAARELGISPATMSRYLRSDSYPYQTKYQIEYS